MIITVYTIVFVLYDIRITINAIIINVSIFIGIVVVVNVIT